MYRTPHLLPCLLLLKNHASKYRILPSNGAGCSNKVTTDSLETKLSSLVSYDRTWFLQTSGGPPLLGEAPLTGRLYTVCSKAHFLSKGYSIKKCRRGGRPSHPEKKRGRGGRTKEKKEGAGVGLSNVCLRGLKCTKRGSLQKRGGLSLKNRGGVGVQNKKKKRGRGGLRNEKKEGAGGGQISKGGLPPPHIL